MSENEKGNDNDTEAEGTEVPTDALESGGEDVLATDEPTELE